MQLTKHSRILVLVSVSFACVALNYWLITTGHYRLPLLVFIGAIALIMLALRKLSPSTKDPKEIKNNLLKASSSARRPGVLHIIGFAVAIVSLLSGEFKDVPTWAVVLAFGWGGFLIWHLFRGAKWYKERADASTQDTLEVKSPTPPA